MPKPFASRRTHAANGTIDRSSPAVAALSNGLSLSLTTKTAAPDVISILFAKAAHLHLPMPDKKSVFHGAAPTLWLGAAFSCATVLARLLKLLRRPRRFTPCLTIASRPVLLPAARGGFLCAPPSFPLRRFPQFQTDRSSDLAAGSFRLVCQIQ